MKKLFKKLWDSFVKLLSYLQNVTKETKTRVVSRGRSTKEEK